MAPVLMVAPTAEAEQDEGRSLCEYIADELAEINQLEFTVLIWHKNGQISRATADKMIKHLNDRRDLMYELRDKWCSKELPDANPDIPDREGPGGFGF